MAREQKGAHLWDPAFHDSGLIRVLVSDVEPTEQLPYSTDEGDSWKEYNFGRQSRTRDVEERAA